MLFQNNRAILVQIALLLISQPRNLNQSIRLVLCVAVTCVTHTHTHLTSQDTTQQDTHTHTHDTARHDDTPNVTHVDSFAKEPYKRDYIL